MTTISITLPPEVSKRALLALLAASTTNIPNATTAVLRRSTNDGTPLTDEQGRGVVLFMRAWAAAEFARLSGAPSNGINVNVAVAGSKS